MKNPTEIDTEILRETELAILVNDGATECWLPKSQIEYDAEVGETTTITIPEWLAKGKGLI